MNAEEIRTKLRQEFLDVPEVAEILGIHVQTVADWFDNGHLEGVNIAPPLNKKRLLRIKSSSVQKLLGIDDLAEV